MRIEIRRNQDLKRKVYNVLQGIFQIKLDMSTLNMKWKLVYHIYIDR